MITNKFIVSIEDEDERIDKYLASRNETMSRSRIQKLLEDQKVTVNDKVVKSNYKICEDDVIVVNIPEPVAVNIEPQNIPLDIVYEDDDIIIINKPRGLGVHPAPGH